MNYYEVLVTQEYIARDSVFTYASPLFLKKFQFVLVPMQKTTVAGIIVKNTSKPAFATKEITQSFGITLREPQRQLVRFIKQYYAATEAQALQLFIPSFLKKIDKIVPSVAASAFPVPSGLPPLTENQHQALGVLRSYKIGTSILHGDTGSGKTRIYIERIRDTVSAGKSVLLLTPEIALVPQLMKQLKKLFGDHVVSYHSQATLTKRAAVWARVASSEQLIVVGTRSALFLPLQNIGLIVIDEAHEPAYKQEEGVRYHASRIASVLAASMHAQLILGSATPLVSDMYLAHERGRPIVRMQGSAVASDKLSHTVVIDMKNRPEFTTHPMLGNSLLAAIQKALAQGEQSLVYLNRRGTAKIILCQSCGWQAMCPVCDIALTYHHDTHSLRCHTCGYNGIVPHACPVCKSADIIFKSAGTKALADWLQKRFPAAQVGRFDTDNSLAESLHMRHAEVASGHIDILVGTQMLVKGLDLKHLSVVGIVAADLSLQIPDFSAEERTFQLLQQAIGRVGRGHTNGTTIIQTFNPDNKVIQQAIAKNYDDFYTTQIQQRQTYSFSPITFLAVFWCSRVTAASAITAAEAVIKQLRKTAPECTFLGPVTAFHPKRRGMSTAQIVVKSASRQMLVKLANSLPSGWQYDLEPINLI